MQLKITNYETQRQCTLATTRFSVQTERDGVFMQVHGVSASDSLELISLSLTQGRGEPWNEAHGHHLSGSYYFNIPAEKYSIESI